MRYCSYASKALGTLSALLVVDASSVPRPFDIGQGINTTSGIIHGHAASDRRQVSEYLGIPFAQPPVQNLRFAAPEPYRSSANYNASTFGLSCLAPVTESNYTRLTEAGFNLAPTIEEYYDTILERGVAMGEDCLTLNVWTKPQTGERAKAVLFFVYGGGFQIGFSSNPFTNGQYLADEQDVVVISANYRINVFGFPGLHPETAGAGVAPNPGLLDQRLAVEWARDNVAAFGGDPSRITLFGQSAGAASISMYGYAYASDPIAHALITQSGTADGFGAAPSDLGDAWRSLSTLLGCNSNSTSSTDSSLAQNVSCVRSRPAADVLAASRQIPPSVSALGAFVPSADGRTAFSNYSALAADGHFARVPRLIGSNADEGRSFRLEFVMQGANLPAVFWEWYTLAFFTCPAAAAVAGFASSSRTAGRVEGAYATQPPPVWRYSYRGDYPNTHLTVNPSAGAYHGAELPPLFGTAEFLGAPDTPAERAMGRYMGAAWAAFAKDPYGGLARAPFRWPPAPALATPSQLANTAATALGARTVVLGNGNATSAVFEPSPKADAPCAVIMPSFEAIGGPVGLLSLAGAAGGALDGIEDDDVIAVAEVLLRLAGVGTRAI